MAVRRVNPRAVKLHRSYSVSELAACFGVHKNTVRHWQQAGLEPIDRGRPVLFQGAEVKAFLTKRNARRKCPCPPGTIYCFGCREPRPPAHGMLDYMPITADCGKISAICGTCETIMNRHARKAALALIMPGCEVQIVQAPARLKGCSPPPLNCDLERQDMA